MVNFDVDIHGRTYAQYAKFVAIYSQYKLRDAMILASPFILKWDFEVDLSSKNPLLQLSMEDGAAVVKALFEYFKELYDGAKVSDVVVDFSKWNMDKFTNFDELHKKGDVSQYEPMLHEIAVMKGISPDKPLTLYQGLVIMKAVNEKIGKVFNGGN